MGRSKDRGRRQRNRNRGNRDRKPNTAPGERGNYELAKTENELFEEYYKTQGIIPPEEWDEFMTTLRSPLPSSIRITSFKSQAKDMVENIQSIFSKLCDVEVDGEKVPPPKCIEWYPGNLAWQIHIKRSIIRKVPLLKNFHKFLNAETESGNISRQETVSMIPPLVLDVKPHHKILDMCAAPGSKTAQLVEYLHADGDTIPEGFVIANDADNKRSYLMVHQINRLSSPCYIVTNHDASVMPQMKIGENDEYVTYDRILADVPCSGDGTLRKNPDAWRKWGPGNGNSLHGLQTRILKRGLELLAVGGKLVYSTCSLNPVEDEAVIASMLQKCEGTVELQDINIPGLKFRPGVTSWKVKHKNAGWFTSFDEVPENLTAMQPSFFPPTREVATGLHLDKCIRILPHQQDTGGFFVALLVKTKQLPWLKADDKTTEQTPGDVENKESENGAEGGSIEKQEQASQGEKRKEGPDTSSQPAKKRRHQIHKEDPFIFLAEDDPEWEPIKKFYDVSDDFPNSQLMIRCATGKKRNIYLVSKAVKSVTQKNEDVVKFINMGLRVLCRSDNRGVACNYRLAQEGIYCCHPYFRGRQVTVTKDDIITLLTQENPFFTKMSEKTREQLNLWDSGSLIYIYKPTEESSEGPKSKIVFCGWKGKTSCRSFVPKMEREHLLRLCGVELEDDKPKVESTKSDAATMDTSVDDAPEDGDVAAEDGNVGDDGDTVGDDSGMGGDEVADVGNVGKEVTCDEGADKDGQDEKKDD